MRFPGNVTISHSFASGGMHEEIKPKADGYLGSWSGESFFTINIEPKTGLYLLWRAAKRNPITKRFDQIEILHPRKPNGRRDVYRATIGTSPTQDDWVTKSPRNHVSMAWITREENNLNIGLWQLAIVTQADPKDAGKLNFFFTVQVTHESPLFRDSENRLVAPNFPRLSDPDWNDVRRLIYTVLTNVPALPAESDQAKNGEATKTLKLADNHGQVLWYNLAGNNGIIVTQAGNAKVAWKNIKTTKRFKSLEADQFVEFKELIPATDPRTKISLEVRGVRVIGR